MNDKTALLSSGDGAGTVEEGKGKPDDKLSWTIKIIYGTHVHIHTMLYYLLKRIFTSLI